MCWWEAEPNPKRKFVGTGTNYHWEIEQTITSGDYDYIRWRYDKTWKHFKVETGKIKTKTEITATALW